MWKHHDIFFDTEMSNISWHCLMYKTALKINFKTELPFTGVREQSRTS